MARGIQLLTAWNRTRVNAEYEEEWLYLYDSELDVYTDQVSVYRSLLDCITTWNCQPMSSAFFNLISY